VRLACLLALVAACSSSSKPRPYADEICYQGCLKLVGCPSSGLTASECDHGCHGADPSPAPCIQGCLSLPSCSAEYQSCLTGCQPPLPADCNPSCAGCAANDVCFGGNGDGIGEFSAACLQRCQVTGDCAVGRRCVEESSVQGRATGRVCVSPPDAGVPLPTACTSPIICTGTYGPQLCADGHSLELPFYSPGNHLCGEEFLACDAGCAGATADGGVRDGDVEGHCL
jgi:hypothetical protein